MILSSILILCISNNKDDLIVNQTLYNYSIVIHITILLHTLVSATDNTKLTQNGLPQDIFG